MKSQSLRLDAQDEKARADRKTTRPAIKPPKRSHPWPSRTTQ